MIYTLGYRNIQFPDFKNKINDMDIVIADIRLKPYSPMSPFWSINYLKECFGSKYQHIYELGNLNYKTPGKYNIVNIDAGIDKLQYLYSLFNNIIMMCACENYESCHRRLISEEVSARIGIVTQELNY